MDFGLTTSDLGDGVHVVEIVGEIDLFTAPEFKQALNLVIDGGGRAVLVDLSATTFIDSTALGVLIGAVKRLRPSGGELAIACHDPSLRTVFEITRLDRAFEMFDSTGDAVRHLRASVVRGHA